MKRISSLLCIAYIATLSFSSCKKDVVEPISHEETSQQTLTQIKKLGFSTADVHKVEEGYIVEGDILLTEEHLASTPAYQVLRVGNEEQYRTTNMVKYLPRTLTIAVSGLGSAFVEGTDLAIARYNALNLSLKFKRITSGTASITIVGFNQAPSNGSILLGSAGFPTSNGEAYRQIKMNTNPSAYGSNPNVEYVGSVIQHEIGHCIGLRHTDYMDRSYSCGGAVSNEGASNTGAILIPGTPSSPDAASWMLACSSGGNRTFNANDIKALDYIY